jgi:endonuclease/exonuclease/phosphatase family metal-dependent hydrolase
MTRRSPIRLAVFGGAAVAAAMALVAIVSSDRDEADTSDRWRVGQANLAGWAAYSGSLEAGTHLADAVLDLDLHVVGVAEACQQQLEQAKRHLAQRGPVEVLFHRTVPPDQPLPFGAANDDECVYGLGLIVRGPLALADVSSSELPTLDGDPGGFDREEDRHVVCGRVAEPDESSASLLTCTTHFTRLMAVDERRRMQAEHLVSSVEALAGRGAPALVLGDLNARAGSPDLEPVYASGFRDVGAGDSRDHILVRDLETSVLRTRALGRSDHQLIWTAVAPPG